MQTRSDEQLAVIVKLIDCLSSNRVYI